RGAALAFAVVLGAPAWSAWDGRDDFPAGLAGGCWPPDADAAAAEDAALALAATPEEDADAPCRACAAALGDSAAEIRRSFSKGEMKRSTNSSVTF
ncbi:hypothetical protein THAOC_09796, partial [Thalassiosira oceanica]